MILCVTSYSFPSQAHPSVPQEQEGLSTHHQDKGMSPTGLQEGWCDALWFFLPNTQAESRRFLKVPNRRDDSPYSRLSPTDIAYSPPNNTSPTQKQNLSMQKWHISTNLNMYICCLALGRTKVAPTLSRVTLTLKCGPLVSQMPSFTNFSVFQDDLHS